MTGIMCAIAGMSSTDSSLYPFTTFTFTNAGQTGYTGPSLTTCKTAYNTTTYPWLANTSFFNMVTNGIQRWTVPATGQYRFTAKGASGGTGYLKSAGLAAQMVSTFTLTKGDIIQILVGQMGSTGTGTTCGGDGGGGGGTFVVTSGGTALLVAAGGGGAASNQINQAETKDAVTGTSGRNGGGGPPYGGTGGTSGSGGTYNTGSCVAVGSTGAGFSGNGQGSGPTNALSFTSGGTGGYIDTVKYGGFGGGGSPGTNYCGGAGGGYSGGGGGGLSSCTCNYMASGGAGGSYSSTSFTFTQLATTGHGSVFVERL